MSNIIAQTGRATLSFVPNPALSPDGRYTLHTNDGAGGAVDYDVAVNNRRIAAYVRGEARLLGRGLHPRGGDNSVRGFGVGGAGRGIGARGIGPRGFDLAYRRAATGPLADATYSLAVCAVDAAGNAEASGATASLAIAAAPAPPTDLAADSYADSRLTLTWTASTDDS